MDQLVEFWNQIVAWFQSGQAWQWLSENLLNIACWILGIIATVIVTKLSDRILLWLSTKAKNEKTKLLIEKAKEIIHTVTDATTQKFVSGLKKAGQFDVAKQQEAFNITVKESTELLTGELKKAIKSEYSDIESFIGAEIESHIHDEKVQ